MRAIKYLLVTIGMLGMIASIYTAIVHKEVATNIPSFIASLSLVYLGRYKVMPKNEKSIVEKC
ncbi:hypothetical protein [Dokdonia sp.]|uniref:hypothetical protein n=1 Tax=Dokdonia sp. TaxID=2024995 RepID=UPI003263B39D